MNLVFITKRVEVVKLKKLSCDFFFYPLVIFVRDNIFAVTITIIIIVIIATTTTTTDETKIRSTSRRLQLETLH